MQKTIRRYQSGILLVAMLLSSCSIAKKPDAPEVVYVHPVQLRTVEVNGLTQSYRQASLYASRDGIVKNVNVKIGDRICAGYLVAELEVDQAQKNLSGELSFRQQELQIATKRSDLERTRAQTTLENASESTRREYERSLTTLETDLSVLQVRLKEEETVMQNAFHTLVEVATNFMYTRSDVLTNFEKHSGSDYFRRREFFYPHDAQALAMEETLRRFYKFLTNPPAGVGTKQLLMLAIDTGSQARAAIKNLVSSDQLTPDQISSMTFRLDDVTTRLAELSARHMDTESQIAALQRKKNQLVTQGPDKPNYQPEADGQVYALEAEKIAAEMGRISKQIGAGNSITAPFQGIVTKTYVSTGDAVDRYRPVIDIVDDNHKFIKFFVPEEIYPYVSEGLTVEFATYSNPGTRYSAVIRRIAHTVNTEDGTVQVEADISNPDVTEEMIANLKTIVNLPVSQDLQLLTVPERALELSGNQKTVWVVNEEEQLERRTISTRFIHNEIAYVEAGLSPDDRVVLESVEPVHSKLRVLALEESKPVKPIAASKRKKKLDGLTSLPKVNAAEGESTYGVTIPVVTRLQLAFGSEPTKLALQQSSLQEKGIDWKTAQDKTGYQPCLGYND